MLHLAKQDIRCITQINHQRQPHIELNFRIPRWKSEKKKSAENAMRAGLFIVYKVKAELDCSPVWNCLYHLIERRFCIFELMSVHTAWQHTYTYKIKVKIVNATHTPYLHHRYIERIHNEKNVFWFYLWTSHLKYTAFLQCSQKYPTIIKASFVTGSSSYLDSHCWQKKKESQTLASWYATARTMGLWKKCDFE